MSSDNGIYILKSPIDNGFEYRVIHAQAIDNIYDHNTEHDSNDPNSISSDICDSGINITCLIEYFGMTKAFTDESEAWKEAMEMERKVLSDDFCPILEYGISIIELPRSFSFYEEKARNNQEHKCNCTEGVCQKGLMDKGWDRIPHDFPRSRDYELPNFECRRLNCVANIGGNCVSPACCKIDEEGKCTGFKEKN